MPNPKPLAPATWNYRQVFIATLFVVMVTAAFWLLYRFWIVVVILFIAVLMGTGMKPAVSWFSQRGLPRLYSQILIYFALLVAFSAFVLLVLPLVLNQMTIVTTQLSNYYSDYRTLLVNSPSSILRTLGIKSSPFFQLGDLVQNTPPAGGAQNSDAQTADMVAHVFGLAGALSRGAFFTIAALLMAFYWTLEGERVIRSFLLFLPIAQREEVRAMVNAIEGKLGGFLLGQAVLCLFIAVFSLIAYVLIGLPNALVLAMIAGILEAVPAIGPALGAVPAVLLAASLDPHKIVWVLVATAAIQLLENHLLVPRVMRRSVGVNPLLTLLSLAAFTSLLGLPGALLAIPLAAIFQLMIDRFFLNPLQEPVLKAEGRDHLSFLRLQAQEIIKDTRKQFSNKANDPFGQNEELEEMIEVIASDLESMLAQTSRRQAEEQE